jgi:REP-associated tyrosine transposase
VRITAKRAGTSSRFAAACRKEIFGKIDEQRVVLSRLGEIVRRDLLRISEHFPYATIREFVVMPNHVHAIIGLEVGARYIVPFSERARTPEHFSGPVEGSIPTIVRTFKAAVTRDAKRESGINGEIWQRNYYEHVLRDGEEYARASRYIFENPLRWESDRENAAREKQGKQVVVGVWE